MRIGRCALALWAVVCVQAGSADAQVRRLTLEEILARAREQAPQIVNARFALEETRGRLAGASIRYQTNPEIDAGLGVRLGSIERFTDYELGISQMFEPGSRRSARIDGANAAIAQGAAQVDDTTRRVLHEAATAYHRAVHANERILLLAASEELAAEVFSVADRRFRAGDIAVLDVNIARVSLARVRADREAAEADRTLAIGELKQFLRIEGDIEVDGVLARPGNANLAVALQASAQRPEIRALEAAVLEAEADVRLASGLAQADWGLGLRYSREEGDQVLLGGFTVRLPVASKGQELRAVGTARAARLRAELDALHTRIQLEVRAAFEAYNRRLTAVQVLETDAIPGLDENDTLTTRSFDVGQIGLPELLLIRRETLDTRFQYLDALLEAVLARVNLDASAGLLR